MAKHPFLGIPFLLPLGVIAALLFTVLVSGMRNRRALGAGLTMVVVGLAIYFPIQELLNQATFLMVVIIAVAMMLLGWVAGLLGRLR